MSSEQCASPLRRSFGQCGRTVRTPRPDPWPGARCALRQTTKGYYVPVTVTDKAPEQRILEQSMRLPEGGAVTGWAACRLATGAYFDGLERDGRTRQAMPLLIGGLT